MLRINLKSLRKYEPAALQTFFELVEMNWGRPLTRDAVLALYHEGVRVHLIGGGIRFGADVSYAFYATRMTRTLPLKWTVRCVSGGGANHSDMGGRHAGQLLVAGTVDYGSPAGISSTWTLSAGRDSPGYYLGLFLNEVFLGQLLGQRSESRERVVS